MLILAGKSPRWKYMKFNFPVVGASKFIHWRENVCTICLGLILYRFLSAPFWASLTWYGFLHGKFLVSPIFRTVSSRVYFRSPIFFSLPKNAVSNTPIFTPNSNSCEFAIARYRCIQSYSLSQNHNCMVLVKSFRIDLSLKSLCRPRRRCMTYKERLRCLWTTCANTQTAF